MKVKITGQSDQVIFLLFLLTLAPLTSELIDRHSIETLLVELSNNAEVL